MNIQWYGQSCFKIQSKDLTIFTDPYDKETGFRPARTHADIVTVSHNHHDHNNVAELKDNPFIINTPGEYEIKSVFVKGISSFHDAKNGAERGENTIFTITVEDLTICHLGDLGEELTEKHIERIGEVDILMIPVGEKYTISVDQAIKIINQIEPRVIMPMHYAISGQKTDLSKVDKFLKAMGAKKQTIEKYVIKKKDLAPDQSDVIVFKNLG